MVLLIMKRILIFASSQAFDLKVTMPYQISKYAFPLLASGIFACFDGSRLSSHVPQFQPHDSCAYEASNTVNSVDSISSSLHQFCLSSSSDIPVISLVVKHGIATKAAASKVDPILSSHLASLHITPHHSAFSMA